MYTAGYMRILKARNARVLSGMQKLCGIYIRSMGYLYPDSYYLQNLSDIDIKEAHYEVRLTVTLGASTEPEFIRVPHSLFMHFMSGDTERDVEGQINREC